MKKKSIRVIAWGAFALAVLNILAVVFALVKAASDGGAELVNIAPMVASLALFSAWGVFIALGQENQTPKATEEMTLKDRRTRTLAVGLLPLMFVVASRLYILLLAAVPLAVWCYFHPHAVEKLIASVKAKLASRKQS